MHGCFTFGGASNDWVEVCALSSETYGQWNHMGLFMFTISTGTARFDYSGVCAISNYNTIIPLSGACSNVGLELREKEIDGVAFKETVVCLKSYITNAKVSWEFLAPMGKNVYPLAGTVVTPDVYGHNLQDDAGVTTSATFPLYKPRGFAFLLVMDSSNSTVKDLSLLTYNSGTVSENVLVNEMTFSHTVSATNAEITVTSNYSARYFLWQM